MNIYTSEPLLIVITMCNKSKWKLDVFAVDFLFLSWFIYFFSDEPIAEAAFLETTSSGELHMSQQIWKTDMRGNEVTEIRMQCANLLTYIILEIWLLCCNNLSFEFIINKKNSILWWIGGKCLLYQKWLLYLQYFQ